MKPVIYLALIVKGKININVNLTVLTENAYEILRLGFANGSLRNRCHRL